MLKVVADEAAREDLAAASPACRASRARARPAIPSQHGSPSWQARANAFSASSRASPQRPAVVRQCARSACGQGTDDFVAYAVTVLSGFRATQHISANHVITIDGDRARALAAMSAWHRADMDPGVVDTFMLRGRYDIGMVRVGDSWRMDKLHMTVWDEEGNKAVFQAARQAWEARQAADASVTDSK